MTKPVLSILAAVCSIVVLVAVTRGRQPESVTGGVFLDGEPLSQADLFIVGNEATNSATRTFTRTDLSGRFEITTAMPPGEYRVVVKRLIGDSPYSVLLMTQGESQVDVAQEEFRTRALNDTERIHGADGNRSTTPTLRQLPEIYSSPEHTVLRLHVPTSGPVATDLHLSLDGSQRIAAQQESQRAKR